MGERDSRVAERRRLRREYKDLFEAVSAILFEADPVGINLGFNTDEYDPEVGTILPRLGSCSSLDDARRVISEELHRWFGDRASEVAALDPIAEQVWAAWNRYSGTDAA